MLRILLSGSSGLIGSAVLTRLRQEGHQVIRLVRDQHQEGSDALYWDPAHTEWFEGFDALIHLAGENIADGRWTKKKKERLFLSRCRDSWVLAQGLARLQSPPKIVLAASAIGFYGGCGDEALTEASRQGKGFLSELCGEWESAFEALKGKGARVVHLRFGAVLSRHGGMLARMIPSFRWGLGARLGTGKQGVSWVALEDVVGVIEYALRTASLVGPVNVTAPHPISQAEFATTLAGHLHRPLFLRIPAWLLRWSLGEIAEELFLASMYVIPEKLLQSGYRFRFSYLKEFLGGHNLFF